MIKKNKTFLRPKTLTWYAKEYNLPYTTLWNWRALGQIELPRDEALLAKVKKTPTGRYYIDEA